MASYHRVLEIFGRSVNQKTLECDYDIHPWDMLVDGKRWDGKIRLVGFVDVFFLISYSGESCFEKGIIIYKDDEMIENLLKETMTEADKLNEDLREETKAAADKLKLQVTNKAERTKAQDNNKTFACDEEPPPPKYFKFDDVALDYDITSLGYEIGVKTRYDRTKIRRYDIKIRKGRDFTMKRRMRRGVTQHDLVDLMLDAVRLGIITQAELIGHIVGVTIGGSMIEDVGAKYLGALTGAKNRNVALAGDRN